MTDVLKNGLVGNGQDEDGHLEQIIEQAPPGATIYFPATERGYAFRKPIVISKSLTIVGDGAATIIKSNVLNDALFKIAPASFTEPIVINLKDFKMTDGYRGIDITGAIHISGTISGTAAIAPQSTIQNVEIDKFKEIGINFTQKEAEIFIKDVRVSSSLYGFFGKSFGNYNQLYVDNSFFEGSEYGIYFSGATNASGAIAFNYISQVNNAAGFVFENITYTLQSPTYINTPIQVVNSGSTQASSLVTHASTHASGAADQILATSLTSQGVDQGALLVSAGDGSWTTLQTASLVAGTAVNPSDFNPYSASMKAATGSLQAATGALQSATASLQSATASLQTFTASIYTSFTAHTASYLISSASFAGTRVDLDAHLLDVGNPHATSIGNLDPGTLAELNTAISDANLISQATFEAFTGSTNSFTASAQSATASLQSVTASLQSATASLQIVSGTLLNASASYALFSASHAEMHLSGGRDPIDAQSLRANGLAVDRVLISNANGGWTTVLSHSMVRNAIFNVSGAISGGVRYIDFTGSTPVYGEGRLFYDETEHSLAVYNDDANVTHQLGQEGFVRVYNGTGALIENGSVVYLSGTEAGEFRPTVAKAKADVRSTSRAFGITTNNISNGAYGYVTLYGLVNDLDTSAYSPGERIYLSDKTAGFFTSSAPATGSLIVPVGSIIKSHATTGRILVDIGGDLRASRNYEYINHCPMHPIVVQVSASTTNITAILSNSTGRNYIPYVFDNAEYLLPSPSTIILSGGTATVPKTNYLFIRRPDGELIFDLNTTGFPNQYTARVAKIGVLDAATTLASGALSVHTYNDDPNNQNVHIGDRIRVYYATWDTGCSPTITVTTIPSANDDVWFSTTTGKVFQFHEHDVQAFNMSGALGDYAYVPNDSVAPWKTVKNLNQLLTDSAGVSMSGKYFSLVFWAFVNEITGESTLCVNLPAGSYNGESLLTADASKYANYSIPGDYRGNAFLIAEGHFRHQSTGNGTWTLLNTIDLRGYLPNVTAGGGTALATEFEDSVFRIVGNVDATKQVAFEVDGLTTATTRTITVADENIHLSNLGSLTQSLKSATGSLQSATASLQSATASLYVSTGSLTASVTRLNAASASFVTFHTSQTASITRLNAASASFVTFHTSQTASITRLNAMSATFVAHASRHLSGGVDPIDAQSLRGNGLAINQLLISNGAGGWTTVASQSVGGAGGGVSQAAFNAFTASTNAGTASLQSATASLYVSTGSLTASVTRLDAASASFVTFHASQTGSITRLNAMSATFAGFSASHGEMHLSGGRDPLDVQNLRGNGLAIDRVLISNGAGGWTTVTSASMISGHQAAAHGSTHLSGASDAINAQSLGGSGLSADQVMVSDGAGGWKTVASQSVGGAGGGGVSQATFDAFTASTNAGTSSIQSATASLQSATGSLQSATASLQIFTASVLTSTGSLISFIRGIQGFSSTNYLNIANGTPLEGNNSTGFEILAAIFEASGGFKSNAQGQIVSQRDEFGSTGYKLGVDNFTPDVGVGDGAGNDDGMTNAANWLYNQNYRLAFLSLGTNLTRRRATLNGEQICTFNNGTSGYTSSSNGVSVGRAAGTGDGTYSGVVSALAWKTTGLFTQVELEKLILNFLKTGSFGTEIPNYSFNARDLNVGAMPAGWTDDVGGLTFVTTGSLSVIDLPLLGITEQNSVDVDRYVYRSKTANGSLITPGYSYQNTAGPHTVDAVFILCDSSAATIGLTCPSNPDQGAKFEVIDIGNNAEAANITVTRAGSQTINGGTTYVLNKNAERVAFVYDGTNWAVDGLRKDYTSMSSSYSALSASFSAISSSYISLSASYVTLSASFELENYIKTSSWSGTAFTMSSADNGYFWRMTGGTPKMWITTSIKQGTTAEFQRKGTSLTITGSQQVKLEYDSGTFAYPPVAGGINSTIVVSVIYSDATMTTASLRGDFG